MLDLSTAVLCDFAQVRDRLLFVSSGAVSRLYRQELPSPLGLMVGLVIEVPLEDAGMDHRLRAEVINRHGTVLATLENLFRVSDAGLFPHEVQQVPLVLSITGVRARTWGTHQVRLYLDDELVRALTLYVVPAAGPQGAAVRPTPTQSREADAEGNLGGTGTGTVEATPAGEGDDGGTEPSPEADPVGASAPGEEAEGRPDSGGDEPAGGDDQPAPVSWGTPGGGDAAEAPGEGDAGAGTGDESSAPADADPVPAFRTATIAAEPAEPADADPQLDLEGEADEPAGPEAEAADAEDGGGKSRFAFRYRYEDDEG